MSEPTNVTETPSAAPPPKPALPPKPAPPAKTPAKSTPERRIFLLAFFGALFGSWIAVAWTTLTFSMLGMVLGTVRFLFPNVLSEPPSKVKAGFPDQYEEGKVVDRFKDQNFWVVRYQGIIYALSTTCTHLKTASFSLTKAKSSKKRWGSGIIRSRLSKCNSVRGPCACV